MCWKGYTAYNPAGLLLWWFCCIWNFYVPVQLNRLHHTPTLFPSSHLDIISNHRFLLVNTGQRGLERNTLISREGRDLSTIHGTSMTLAQCLKLGNVHNLKHWLWLLFDRYKLLNSLWIQSFMVFWDVTWCSLADIHWSQRNEHTVSIFREMMLVPIYQTTVSNLLTTIKCCLCKTLNVTISEGALLYYSQQIHWNLVTFLTEMGTTLQPTQDFFYSITFELNKAMPHQ